MTLVVGCGVGQRSLGALHLAATMARSGGTDLRVVAVVPEPPIPGIARVDAEYQEHVRAQADAALDAARRAVPADIPATYVRHEARSIPAGLVEVAEEADARFIVVGSSSAGLFGRITLGSVTDWLVHSSPLPLAFAPRGFRAGSVDRVTRVTAAYSGAAHAEELVDLAADVAERVAASLRVASFAVYPPAPLAAGLGADAEEDVVDAWQRDVLERHPDAVIGRGRSWSEALDDIEWADGDVLVVGSSSAGPLERVFLGSQAAKIVRHAPVPVVVVPRGAVEDAHQTRTS